jgi:tetratricopeptide (TPR) repeat protein
MGHTDKSIDLIAGAIRLDGGQAYFHMNLGEAYRAAGRLDDATTCYLRAISLQPALPEPYYNLALTLYQQGDKQAGLERCRQAVTINPNYFQAHNDLGNMLYEAGNLPESQAAYERALAVNPTYFDALVNLANVLRQRGQSDASRQHLLRAMAVRPDAPHVPIFLGDLESQRDGWPEAVGWYQRAVELDPSSERAVASLASALQGAGRLDEAIAHYERAIALQGDVAKTHFNFATALEEQGRVADAVRQYELTLKYDPAYVNAHINLGAHCQDEQDVAGALAHYDEVLKLRPDSAHAHYNRALILLRSGDFPAGWPEYHWRLKLPKFPLEVMEESLWDGSDLAGRTLLVHAEQGLGDTLHFIRYLPIIKERHRSVIMRVHPPIVPLLRQSGFDVLGHDEPLPHFDVQVPLISLPGMLGTNLANIPASIPYLKARPDLIERWRDRLRDVAGFRVGICWQGSKENKSDVARSMPLAAFEALASIDGVRLICLQKREGLEQLTALQDRLAVHHLGEDLDEAEGAFMDTAAVMKNLDLVITADTAIAHLAGGLGVPVWIPLSTRADWRWMLNREDTPWYPTMRLFRQTKYGQWRDVFERMAESLRARLPSPLAGEGGSRQRAG